MVVKIASFKYRANIQYLNEKPDPIGNPIKQWVRLSDIWVSLKPIYNYRQHKNCVGLDQIADPYYHMTARSLVFYDDDKGHSKNIWHTIFRLEYKKFFLKPLVAPSFDLSKQWVHVVVKSCAKYTNDERKN